jgi:PPK2 family polyphosphate:nucleotide phosphotransferase
VDSIPLQDLIDPYVATPSKKFSLGDFDPSYKPEALSKAEANILLKAGIKHLAKYQDMLYAQRTYAMLIILQGMDASGKDGLIEHVMTGLNPQGVEVHSFKVPSEEELNHDYMWRCCRRLPERGRMGIFNRSYYEDVLIARVHPEVLERQRIPAELKGPDIWKRRFEEINNFERYLTNNGVQIIKIYLNLSKEEQRQRFLARIEQLEKNWKFSAGDAKERASWDKYMDAYEDAIRHTSTDAAPWYVVPADKKWFCRLVASNIIYTRLKSLNLQYPVVDDAQKRELAKARKLLEQEASE